MSIVWLDGELVDKADAKIGVADHGLLFGDGVNADMRAYGGRVYRLPQHLERLQVAADDIGLSLPVGSDVLTAAIDTTLRANNRTDGFVKVVVTRGAGPLTLDPRKCVPVTIILAEEAAPFPRELYDCGLDTHVTWIGWYPIAGSLSADVRVKMKRAALAAGCLEAIGYYSDPSLTIGHGSETDVAVVSGGAVRFATGGITHDAVADLAEAGGIPVEREARIYHRMLVTADEVFLTSAAAEIIAVRSIDGKPIGTGGEGPVVRRLREAFRTLVRTECAVS